MADFCKQCSIKIFGHDYGDLANLTSPEDTAAELYAKAICEGCGFTYVDHTGACVYKNCLESHGECEHEH